MASFPRAADRFRTEQPGITTWHSFSSGEHYDASNLSFGPVIACDEHLLDPGAGFDTHPHARLELVSWVLEGSLRHEDDSGRSRVVGAGQAQYQRAGHGIRHAERNASDSEPLHFVQFWLLTEDELPDYDITTPPVALSIGTFSVLRRCHHTWVPAAPSTHLYVASGRYRVAGRFLGPGDSVRLEDESMEIVGDGEMLVLDLDIDPYGHRWRDPPTVEE